MKKLVSLVLIFVFTFAVSSCGENSDSYQYEDNTPSYTVKEYSSVTKTEAISIAQKSKKVTDKIAEYHDLKFYYDPDWGTCTAEKSSGGWRITLKGNITGYADDYKKDFRYDKQFKATVLVSAVGVVGNVSVTYG